MEHSHGAPLFSVFQRQRDRHPKLPIRFLRGKRPAVALNDPPAGIQADIGALSVIPVRRNSVPNGKPDLFRLPAANNVDRLLRRGILQKIGVDIVKSPVQQAFLYCEYVVINY